MTTHQQTDDSPFFFGQHGVRASVRGSIGPSEDMRERVRERLRDDTWTLPQEPETLIEDTNAADVHEALLEAPADDPDSYAWHNIGEIKGGGVYIGPSPADFVKSDNLQIAKRESDGQLLLRYTDSDTIMEVRNALGRPYPLSADEAAEFIAQFSGYDSQGSKRKFAQSDIMNG